MSATIEANVLPMLDAAELAAMTHETLVEVTNVEDDLAAAGELSALGHALRVGQALIEAKARVDAGRGKEFSSSGRPLSGGWGEWVRQNFNRSEHRAREFMRLARNRDLVLESGVTSINQALALEDLVHVSSGPAPYYEGELDEAVLERVRRGEISTHKAADEMGTSPQAVYRRAGATFSAKQERATEARKRERRRRAAAERKALQRQEERKSIVAAGQAVATMHMHIRKAQDIYDKRAGDEVTSPEVRTHLDTCYRALNTAEDEIVRASRLS